MLSFLAKATHDDLVFTCASLRALYPWKLLLGDTTTFQLASDGVVLWWFKTH